MEPDEPITSPVDWEMVDQEQDDPSPAERLDVREGPSEPTENPEPPVAGDTLGDQEEPKEPEPEPETEVETEAERRTEPSEPSLPPAAEDEEPRAPEAEEPPMEPFEFVERVEPSGRSATIPETPRPSGTPAETGTSVMQTVFGTIDYVLDATGKAAKLFLSSGQRHKFFLPVLVAVFAAGFLTGFEVGALQNVPEPIKLYLEMKGDVPSDFLDEFEKQLNSELLVLKHPGVDLVPYVENKIDWSKTCLIFMVEMAESSKTLDQAVKTRIEELSKKTGGNSVLSVVYKTDSVAEVNPGKVPSSLSTQGARSSFHLDLRRSRGYYDHKKNAAEARKFATNFVNIKAHERPL